MKKMETSSNTELGNKWPQLGYVCWDSFTGTDVGMKMVMAFHQKRIGKTSKMMLSLMRSNIEIFCT